MSRDSQELIERYITGSLSEEERIAFEQQMDGSSSLKKEVAIQKQIIQEIQQARIRELKATLNNVSISGHFLQTLEGKIIATTLLVGGLSLALYFSIRKNEYFTHDPVNTNQQKERISNYSTKTKTHDTISTIITKKLNTSSQTKKTKKEIVERKEIRKGNIEDTVAKKKSDALAAISIDEGSQPIKKSEFIPEPIIPSTDMIEFSSDWKDREENIFPASLENDDYLENRILMDTKFIIDGKHNFHYKFDNNMLTLYGSFKGKPYEIIETEKNSASLYMYYNENYYFLERSKTEITPLSTVKSDVVIKKLENLRKK